MGDTAPYQRHRWIGRQRGGGIVHRCASVRRASDGMQGGQGMDASPPRESPRLVALERALASGDGTSLDAFWRAVARDGTPLIEPIPDDPDQALVTFL